MGALFWRSKKIRQRPILLWGWLCGPRVSREAGCVDPVCLVGLAVWTPCVLWGWLCGPRVSCGAGATKLMDQVRNNNTRFRVGGG
jgi:hypothetical protein